MRASGRPPLRCIANAYPSAHSSAIAPRRPGEGNRSRGWPRRNLGARVAVSLARVLGRMTPSFVPGQERRGAGLALLLADALLRSCPQRARKKRTRRSPWSRHVMEGRTTGPRRSLGGRRPLRYGSHTESPPGPLSARPCPRPLMARVGGRARRRRRRHGHKNRRPSKPKLRRPPETVVITSPHMSTAKPL
jgi:hypothetical protein